MAQSKEFRLYKIRECGYEQGVQPAEAYVAAQTSSAALREFTLRCGEVRDVNIEQVQIAFYFAEV